MLCHPALRRGAFFDKRECEGEGDGSQQPDHNREKAGECAGVQEVNWYGENRKREPTAYNDRVPLLSAPLLLL